MLFRQKTPKQEILSAPTLSPLDIHPRTSLIVVEQLRRNHYLNKTVDDELSEHVFDKYLAVLDPGHYYFIAGDIREFEKYRFRLDDALKSGDLDPAFLIFNRYQQRIVERLNYLIGLIDSGLENLDFSKEESISLLAEQLRRDDIAERAREQEKESPLGDELPPREKLAQRYDRYLQGIEKADDEDVANYFLSAVARSHDPHTEYFSARELDQFNVDISNKLVGIGALLRAEDDGATKIEGIVNNGPADKAGELQLGDRVIAVDSINDGVAFGRCGRTNPWTERFHSALEHYPRRQQRS